MALGEILKNARVQKGLSPSDVAEATHMMVQVVEDLEREDFRRIAAPIYGRGFVKLYAEMLELDPEPLVRDFMDLYSGSRAPAVRTKRAEAPEPLPEKPPRTAPKDGAVSPLAPQRQPVQAKPLVRSLHTPQTDAASADAAPAATPVRVEEELRPAAAAPVSPAPQASGDKEEPAVAAKADDRPGWVVEPEEEYSESAEPDLFHPQPPRRKPAAEEPTRAAKTDEAGSHRKQKFPIFKIGGRMEKAPPESEIHDEASHARRLARIQKFVNGFNNLKQGVESKLPTALPSKQIMVFGGAGLALLVCMAAGIHVLFKMTGSNVKEKPGALIESVALPPDLYVD